MTYMTDTMLPDPDLREELYADVPSKRLIAWVIDVILISVMTLVLLPFTAFLAIFILPAFYAVISFLYRWVTITRGSATLGMRVAAVELRQADGQPMDMGSAFLHTAGYFVSVAVFPLQLISIALMLMTDRKQSLTDHVLGSAALNKRAA